MAECSCRVNIVAWIDAHLFTILRSHIGHTGVEVYVGHEWCHDALLLQCPGNIAHILGLTGALRGQSDEFATGSNDALRLTDAGLRIIGVGCGHRLYANGVIATNGNGSHVGNSSLSTLIAHQLPFFIDYFLRDSAENTSSAITASSVCLKIVFHFCQIAIGFLNLLAESSLVGCETFGNNLIG